MKAARFLTGGSRDREEEEHVDWNKCFICQDSSKTSKSTPLRKTTIVGVKTVAECCKEREKYNDAKYVDSFSRIRKYSVPEHVEKIQWHKFCYSDFTHAQKIDRLKSRIQPQSVTYAEEIPTTSGSSEKYHVPKSLRSAHSAMDWSKCAFCQTDIPGKAGVLTNVEFDHTSSRMLSLAQFDPTMRHRFAGVSDLMAAEGKYHLKCYVSFRRKYKKESGEKNQSPESICFRNVMNQLEKELQKGHVFSLKNIWEHYSMLLLNDFGIEAGAYKSYNFKQKVEVHFGSDKVTFVQPLDVTKPLIVASSTVTKFAMRTAVNDLSEEGESSEEDELAQCSLPHHENEILSWIFRVGIKIYSDVKHSPGHSIIGGLNTENAERIVPETLYMLVKLLCGGDSTDKMDNEEADETDTKNKVLSICQDIIHVASGGKKLTPKHLGLGLALHQATRSKELVNLFHAAAHTVGYDTVRRIDTAIANDVIQCFRDNGNVMIPRNFLNIPTTTGYLRYSNDNIDIIEETLTGSGTFHASQCVALRRKGEQEPVMDIQIKPGRSKVLSAPPEMTSVQEANMTNLKPEPVFSEPLQHTWYSPVEQKIKAANTQELAWILARLHQQNNQAVPGWSGFNQKMSTVEPPVTVIGPMPILNAPAHDFDTLWTVLQKCQAMTKKIGEKYTVITFDEQLYCKAKMLQWDKNGCQDLVIMLGGFHIQLNFTKVLGQYMDSSGLENIWMESGVLGGKACEQVIKGKGWNRVIRVHKLTLEALWSVLWACFTAWAKENDKLIRDDLKGAAGRVSDAFANKDDRGMNSSFGELLSEVEEVQVLFQEFEATCSENATFRFWRTYMKLISILLRFTHALREGDWILFLTSFAEMLPWFAAFDHFHYSRWGAVFLADMHMLPTTAPEVHRGFLAGDFVTKETKQKFNEIPDDQAIEHVNKAGKVAGGLVGITKTDSARDRWALSFNERAQLTRDTKNMFTLAGSEEDDDDEHDCAHKDFGPKRMIQDQEYVLKLIDLFKTHNPFDRTSPELVSITTGDIASDVVTSDLLNAEITGKQLVIDFVEDRLINKTTRFHDRIKSKNLHTFESMYTVEVKVGKEKMVTLKADRKLLTRVVTAMQAGRDVDMNKMLEQEICAVPLSLAMPNGRLRLPLNKADLGKILQQGLPNVAPEPLSTCTIIDGMALIQALGNRMNAKTLGEWADSVADHISHVFSNYCSRVDLAFDQYRKKTIKSTARSQRIRGKKAIRRDVQTRSQSMGQWNTLICLDENKASLANFLCTELANKFQNHEQELVLNGGFTDPAKVWTSSGRDVSHLSSPEHEEADTRILLHAKEAYEQGYMQTVVVSRDTDVLILLVAYQPHLSPFLWMNAGTPKKQHYIPIDSINIPDSQRESLLAFHAVTGSDSTSQFAGIAKRSAWAVFQNNSHLLNNLGKEEIPDESVIADAESFVCRLYDPHGQDNSIQRVRCDLFLSLTKAIENLPPTRDALILHIKRAHYQTFVWRRALESEPHLPAPENCGWEQVVKDGNETFQPRLMTAQPITAYCVELTTCKCRGSCSTRRCKCTRNGLPCTKACGCKALCRNPFSVQADQ